jgi:hypothetical protein
MRCTQRCFLGQYLWKTFFVCSLNVQNQISDQNGKNGFSRGFPDGNLTGFDFASFCTE